MSTNRAKMLEKMAMNLTGENAKVAQQQEQARTIGIQNFAKQASEYTTSGQVAAAGAQTAAQGMQIQQQRQQQDQAAAQGIAQQGVQQQQRQQQQQQMQRSITLDKSQMDSAQRLARISSSLKNKLIDEQLTFQKDKAGQAVLNERHLADWAAIKAQSAEELKNYQQLVKQTSDREIQTMKQASALLEQTINQGYLKGKQSLDNAQKKQMLEQKMALDKDIREREKNRNNRLNNWSAVGKVVGGVTGFVLGLPGGPATAAAGAAAGAEMGGAATGAIGASREKGQ